MKTNNKYEKIKITFTIVSLVMAIVMTLAVNTQAATWTQKADMPTARWNHSAAVVDGKIYIIGGLTSETSFLNGQAISAVEQYDPATDTWARKSDMPAPRGYLAKSSPVIDGKIYVIGGGNPAVARVDVYDPAADEWSRAADMPTPRELLATIAWNGKIYAFGGLSTLSNLQALNTVEVYDPKTDSWAQASTMPRGVWEQSANEIDGKVFLIGGASSMNAERILQIYDLQTDTWTNATPMPINTRGFDAAVMCRNIYTIGGWLNSGQYPYANTRVYDTHTDMWTETVPLPDVRAGLTTSAVNGRIYAIGGTPRQHNCQATSTVYELELEIPSPSPDLNGDGVVDDADVTIMVEYWHSNEPSCDIAPEPCGDGIVDVSDMVALIECLGQDLDDPTLIVHWAMDESEGDIAFDSAGTNDASVIGEPSWQPAGGRVDGAIQLDGIDDVLVAESPLDPAKGPFSVFLWVRGGDAGQAIISEPGVSSWLSIHPLTGCLMTELTSIGRSGGPLVSETTIIDGNWHRIGFVWDSLRRTLYVDGVAVAEDTQTALKSAVNGFQIGAGKDMAPGTYFCGLIDDVRIYRRVVSP